MSQYKPLNKSLTVEQLVNKKKALEARISNLLLNFSNETGILVTLNAEPDVEADHSETTGKVLMNGYLVETTLIL